MATRCSCSDAARALPRALPLVLLLAAAACVKSMVPGEYEVDPRAERVDADAARDRLSAALRTECPRLAQERKSPTGEARVTVDVESATGNVRRARLTSRTEDDRLNQLFGDVAARMKFIPPADAAGTETYVGRMRMGYSCASDAAVGTIDLF